MIIIGFSADIGYILGDTKEHCRFINAFDFFFFNSTNININSMVTYHLCKCSKFRGTRTRAAFVFVIGFWLLDLANNTVQVSLF